MFQRLLAAPLFALILGVALFGSAFAPAGHGPASVETADAAQTSPVISPRPRQVLRSNTVLLRVRSSDRSGSLTATLNGTRIDEEFGRTSKGVRTMRVSVSHGLRRGRNLLKVKVLRHGLSTRRATVRFFLRRKQALVGAGRDRRIVVGSNVLLGGEVRNARGPKPRWRVVKGPRGMATLKAPRRAGSRFRAKRLGTYVLELRHRRGKALTTDRVKVDVVPPNPMVPIETVPNVDELNAWGIKVGSQFYAVKDRDDFIQALVLKRKTLALVSNNSYDDAGDLPALIKTLDDTDLVIVTRSWGNNHGGFRGFHDSLNGIGIPDIDKLGWNAFRVAPMAGEFSAIGVPGMKVGTGDYRVASPVAGDPHKSGDMRGYLIPDQYKNYGYVAADEHPITIGRPEANPSATDVGFKIRVYDAHTMIPVAWDGTVFNTNGDWEAPGQNEAEAKRMTQALHAIDPGNVVTIQSVSEIEPEQTNYQPPIGGDVSKETMAGLTAAVERVGGSANAFNRAATIAGKPESGGVVYGLVGFADAKEGEAAEVAAGVDNSGDAPIVNTVLRPNEESKFRPTQVVESATGPAALSELAQQPPSGSWPLDDDPGAKKAIAHLGSQDEELGPDPRSAYWTQNLDTDALIRTLTPVVYPGDKGFTRDQFDAAKAQLIKELGWVGKVRRYMAQLATPFADNALPSWEASKTIADRIYEDSKAQKTQINFNFLEFTEAVVGLIPIFGEEVRSATETVSLLFEFAARTYGSFDEGGESAGDDRQIESDKLGAELLAESQRMQASLRSMGDVIVGDYAKLSALGPHAGCNATDPACPKEFSYSENDRAEASADVYRGIERVAYSKLLPLGYPVFVSTEIESAGAPDLNQYYCNSIRPWKDYPDPSRNAGAVLTELDPTDGKNIWKMYTVAEGPGFWDIYPTLPSQGLFDRVFGPVSKSGDPKSGGLGLTFSAFELDNPQYFSGNKFFEDHHCSM